MPAGPEMKTSTGSSLPLKETDVSCQVDGPLADVCVTQSFCNTLDETIEVTYTFPLSDTAAVYAFQFVIGDRVVKGVVKEKAEAKKSYEKAKSQGKTASLLKQEKENLFTMDVANVPAGATVTAILNLQEYLAFDAGTYTWSFPLVAADAFDASRAAGDFLAGGAGAGETTSGGGGVAPVALTVFVNAEREIEPPVSRTYPASVEALETGPGRYVVKLTPGQVPDRDFVLSYSVPTDAIEPTVLFERDDQAPNADGLGGAFLLTLTPPVVPLADLPRQRPIDLCVLIDRSYSMRMGPLAQASAAVRMLAGALSADDAIQVYAFDHDLASFHETEPNAWVSMADETTVPQLNAFLRELKPRGGSDLETALLKAGEIPPRANRDKVIVVITDAAIGQEDRLLAITRKAVEGPTGTQVPETKARLCALGVGATTNRYLVRKLAEHGGGVHAVVQPRDRGYRAEITRFVSRVVSSGPLLFNINVEWDADIHQVLPCPVPELYPSQPLQIVGRYRGSGATTLTISGEQLVPGQDAPQPFSLAVPVEVPATCADYRGVIRCWARKMIEFYGDAKVAFADHTDTVAEEALALSLRHQLMSSYTSFVAVDETEGVLAIKVDNPRTGQTATLTTLKGSDTLNSLVLAAGAATGAHKAYIEALVDAQGASVAISGQPLDITIEEAGIANGATLTIEQSNDAASWDDAVDAFWSDVTQHATSVRVEASAAYVHVPISPSQTELLANAYTEYLARMQAPAGQPSQGQDCSSDEDGGDIDAFGSISSLSKTKTKKRKETKRRSKPSGGRVRGRGRGHARGGGGGRGRSRGAPPARRGAAVRAERNSAAPAPALSLSAAVPAPSAAPKVKMARKKEFAVCADEEDLESSSSSSSRSCASDCSEMDDDDDDFAFAEKEEELEKACADICEDDMLLDAAVLDTRPAPPALCAAAAPPPPPVSTPSPCVAAGAAPAAPSAPPSRSRSRRAPASRASRKMKRLSTRGSRPSGRTASSGGMTVNPHDCRAQECALRVPVPLPRPDGEPFLNSLRQRLQGIRTPGNLRKINRDGEYSAEQLAFCEGKPIGKLDLVFVVDETGSMGSQIRQVQDNLQRIVKDINNSPLCTSLRIGVVGYRDHPPQDYSFVTRKLDLSEDVERVRAAIDVLQANGGGDGPEALSDALYETVRMDWRSDAARVAIVITDAPPHGVGMGDRIGHCPAGISWSREAENLRELGVVCFTVGCGVSGNSELVLRVIAHTTGALYVPLRDVSLLTPLIVGSAETLIDAQRIEAYVHADWEANREEYAEMEDAEIYEVCLAHLQDVRPRGLQTDGMGAGSVSFRDLTLEDVIKAFDALRISGRIQEDLSWMTTSAE